MDERIVELLDEVKALRQSVEEIRAWFHIGKDNPVSNVIDIKRQVDSEIAELRRKGWL